MSTAPRPIRWGILGTGSIATKFATGLGFLPDAEIAAVGSRSQEGAERFGAQFNIPRRHASYAALANDPEVDVIYVSTPHPFHKENTILCLDAGKAVLCEKPFAVNAREAEEMVATARERGLFLMEAMWSRYYPAQVRARELLSAGAIGEPQILNADLGFQTKFNPAGRLFDPALGGGALLDVGVYPVSLASMIFGPPIDVTSRAHLGPTGVDERAAMILAYEGGRFAVLYTATRTNTPHEATLLGSEGMLRIGHDWHKPDRLILSKPGQPDEVIDLPFEGNGYNYEATEVMACLRAGKTESAAMPLDETIAVIRTLDTIRAQWGLKYPGE